MDSFDNRYSLYDFFISYSQKDYFLVKKIIEIIKKNDLSCYDSTGSNIFDVITKGIRSSKAVIFLITNSSIKSEFVKNELNFLISDAENYDKIIIPLIYGNVTIPSLLSKYSCIYINDFEELRQFEQYIKNYKNINDLNSSYDKLFEYSKIDDQSRILTTTIKILKILFNNKDITDNRELKIILLLDKFYNKYCYGPRDSEGVKIAKEMFDLVPKNIYNDFIYFVDNDKNKDILAISYYLTIISKCYEIMYECVDVCTNGDIQYMLPNDIKAKVDLLYLDYKKTNISDEYNDEEENVIKQVPNLAILQDVYAKYGKVTTFEITNTSVDKIDLPINTNNVSTGNKSLSIVERIANHISESNKLFEEIKDDNFSFDFYSCLKMSYERLKNYSIVTGCKAVASDCVEKIAEINEKLQRLEMKSAVSQGPKEEGIKALLGLKKDINYNYDVFISYKHEDLDLAEGLYRYLKSNMINTFFDKESLPEIGESEYFDAIMEALDKSNNFIFISSNLDYLKTDWIKNEMKTFDLELREGRKQGNFIMIFTNDVFMNVVKNNKKNISIQYRNYQILKCPDYKENLISYLNKK